MKPELTVSYPIDFASYYGQVEVCAKRAVVLDREERLAKTPKGRRVAEQLALFVGMCALAVFIARELIEGLGADHPVTWIVTAVMVVLILLPQIDRACNLTAKLHLRNLLAAMRRRAQGEEFNGMRYEFYKGHVELYRQKVSGDAGELTRKIDLADTMRVEQSGSGLLLFMTRRLEDVFAIDLNRMEPQEQEALLAYLKERFYFHKE